MKYTCVALILVLTGCKSSSTSPESDPTELAAVHATVMRIIAADNARDLDAAVGCYTEDAQWLPPGAHPIIGRSALRESYAAMFDAWAPDIQLVSDETWMMGDVAVDRGRTLGHLVSRKGAATRELDDKYMMMLRREPDGAWRIARLMWNTSESAD